MINFPTYKSRLLRLNANISVFVDDNKVGVTDKDDTAVVTLAEDGYYEIVITSGTFAGIDCVALSKAQIEKCTVLLNKHEYSGCIYVKNKKVKYEYME